MHDNTPQIENSLLVIIDIQQAFCDKIHGFDAVLENSVRLAKSCAELDIPTIVTEQYPKGLGQTFSEISGNVKNFDPIEKTDFSAYNSKEFVDRIKKHSRKHIIICGIETHVCVNQTVHALLDEGYTVHVVADACSSRTKDNKLIGLAKMKESGAVITSAETVVFELLVSSKNPKFKTVQSFFK